MPHPLTVAAVPGADGKVAVQVGHGVVDELEQADGEAGGGGDSRGKQTGTHRCWRMEMRYTHTHTHTHTYIHTHI